ncbi:MAG: SoxR reducing system RseC family protein [Thauera sp.]|nr:SoxR reducing system RseC family protein [Thauera sp.]
MNAAEDPGILSQGSLEGVARVVAVQGDQVWVEPEQGGSCGGCASAANCGSKGIGTLASRLEGRRFFLEREDGDGLGELRVGERLVITFGEQSVSAVALLAYGLPLVGALSAAVFTQELAGRDGYTLLAAIAGLGLGFALMKIVAGRLKARGRLTPRVVRRLSSAAILSSGH